MKKINVIDSIMGSGKTRWAIQRMNEAPDHERFIYITPFTKEVERIQENVENRNFIEPNNKNDEGRKLRSLKDLIVQGVDIASTHALFKTADDELIELLTDSGYTLILDEVMDCVEPVDAKKGDITRMKRAGDIEVDEETNQVHWTGDPKDDSKYTEVRLLAQAGNLYYYRGKFMVWSFPPRIFHTFDDVVIMTYLFRGQAQRYYFDMFEFDYEYRSIKREGERYELTDYNVKNERREDLYRLISIYDGKMNDIGKRKNALSVSYLRRMNTRGDKEFFKKVKDNLYNFFTNVTGAKRDDVYYSTLKEVEEKVQPKGYKEPRKRPNKKDKTPEVLIPHNSRATNHYADKWAIAYVFNRYMKQDIKAFFQDNGVTVDDDLLAVSDLLQWIYRSRIRNGEPIELYLPSSRMRGLLEAWANYEI
jgi:hypothetical protein